MAWCETPPHLPVNLFAPSVSARPAPHKHPQLYSILCTPDAPHNHTHSFASTTNSRPPTSDLACICADRRLRQHQHDLRHHPMFSGTMVFGVSPAGTTHESITCSAAWHRSRQGSRRPSWRGAEGRGGAGLLPAVSAASSRSFLPQYRSDLGTIWDNLRRSRGTFELCVSLTQG